MKTQFYDLSIDTLDDGTIRLEQRDYCGETVIVDLHPQQIQHIANGLSVVTHQAQPNGTAERIATLERRMCWMRDRFDECHVFLPPDMYERCAEAPEFHAWLMASIDVATEFCADFTSKPFCSPIKAASESLEHECPPSAAGRTGEHPEREADVRNGELFSET